MRSDHGGLGLAGGGGRGSGKHPVASILPNRGKGGGIGEHAVDVDSPIIVLAVVENAEQARFARGDFAHAIVIDVACPKAARELLFDEVLAKPVQAMGVVSALDMLGAIAPKVDLWVGISIALDREAKKEAVFVSGGLVLGALGFEVGLVEAAKGGMEGLLGQKSHGGSGDVKGEFGFAVVGHVESGGVEVQWFYFRNRAKIS